MVCMRWNAIVMFRLMHKNAWFAPPKFNKTGETVFPLLQTRRRHVLQCRIQFNYKKSVSIHIPIFISVILSPSLTVDALHSCANTNVRKRVYLILLQLKLHVWHILLYLMITCVYTSNVFSRYIIYTVCVCVCGGNRTVPENSYVWLNI